MGACALEKEIFHRLAKAIEKYSIDDSKAAANEAIKHAINPVRAIEEGIGLGLNIVWNRFDNGEIFLPELLMGGEVAEAAMQILTAAIPKEVAIKGRVVIGTVEGDIHDLGKKIVATMLSSAGFEVFDLGVDVPTDIFVEKAREVKADIVACSALMTTSMWNQKKVAEALREEKINAAILVGGAPVTEDWAKRINVNYAKSAKEAVEKALDIVSRRKQGDDR